MGVFDMGRRAWAAPRATVPRAVMARRLESCTDIEGEALPSQSVAATAAASPAASAQSSLPSPGASRPLLASLPSAQSPSPEPVPSSVPASLPSLSGVRSGDGGGGEELLRRRGAAEAGPRTRFTSLHAVIVILLLACALCASLTMLVRQSMNYHAVHGQGVGSGQRATEPRRTGKARGRRLLRIPPAQGRMPVRGRVPMLRPEKRRNRPQPPTPILPRLQPRRPDPLRRRLPAMGRWTSTRRARRISKPSRISVRSRPNAYWTTDDPSAGSRASTSCST